MQYDCRGLWLIKIQMSYFVRNSPYRCIELQIQFLQIWFIGVLGTALLWRKRLCFTKRISHLFFCAYLIFLHVFFISLSLRQFKSMTSLLFFNSSLWWSANYTKINTQTTKPLHGVSPFLKAVCDISQWTRTSFFYPSLPINLFAVNLNHLVWIWGSFSTITDGLGRGESVTRSISQVWSALYNSATGRRLGSSLGARRLVVGPFTVKGSSHLSTEKFSSSSFFRIS